MKKWVFISFMVLIVITMGANESRAQYITFFSAFRSNEVRADDFYEKKQYARALELYQLANKKDPTNQFLKLKMAKTFFRLQRTRESEAMYASIIKNPKVVRPDDRIEYIQCLLENGKIEIGKAALNQFAKDNPKNETAKLLQARFLNLNKFYKDSGLYKVKRLLFNDKSADFSPSFYQDGIAYVSSRSEPLFNIHSGAEDSTRFFDLFKISLIHDSIIGKPEELDQSLNSYYHQGPVTFFDNDRKMIFTSNRQEGLGSSKNLHLYMAERDSGSVKWKNVKLLPFNSNNYSTAHPAMNSAGNMLYFSSDMNGGQGGSDLYQVTYTNGKWGSPSNLGKGVNTKGDEYFPFILNDSVLFFASDGLPGLGKLDIHKSVLEGGKFQSPVNLGAPINSNKDDFGFIFDKTETYGYFSSNRAKHNDDIYYFRTDYVLFSLKIVDELTKKQLEKCTYTLQDELNEETVTAMEENGTRIFKLIPNRKYTLTIGHPIYKQYVRPIWTTNPKEREIKLTAELGRRVKNFVHATIVNDDNDQPESQTNVLLINLDSLRSDSLKRFFDKSEFDFEVDNSTRYVLVSQKGNRIAVEEIKPTKNKKASSMVYTPLRLKKFYPFEIKGIVKDKETKSLLPGYLVTIRDMKLGDSYQIMTDDKGEFSFTGYTYTKYELAVENAENRTAFKDIDYIKAHGQIFELILK